MACSPVRGTSEGCTRSSAAMTGEARKQKARAVQIERVNMSGSFLLEVSRTESDQNENHDAVVQQARHGPEDDARDGMAETAGCRMPMGILPGEDAENQGDRSQNQAQAGDETEDTTVIGDQALGVFVGNERLDDVVLFAAKACFVKVVFIAQRRLGATRPWRRWFFLEIRFGHRKSSRRYRALN